VTSRVSLVRYAGHGEFPGDAHTPGGYLILSTRFEQALTYTAILRSGQVKKGTAVHLHVLMLWSHRGLQNSSRSAARRSAREVEETRPADIDARSHGRGVRAGYKTPPYASDSRRANISIYSRLQIERRGIEEEFVSGHFSQPPVPGRG
jgi:hypothetical protein